MSESEQSPSYDLNVLPAERSDLVRFRDMYRQEMNCQIIHDSFFERGFTSLYLLHVGGQNAGYGCVGDYDTKGREVVTELYVTPTHRRLALPLLRALISTSGATQVEAQSNDRLLTLLLYDVCRPESIASERILFEDAGPTCLPPPPGAIFRAVPAEEKAAAEQRGESLADWGIEIDGRIVGSAGFLCHYNPPYGDLYMEVDADYRRQGIGSYLLQEVKKVCYAAGRRPAARCNAVNVASRRTLQRAGMLPCARMLRGVIAKD